MSTGAKEKLQRNDYVLEVGAILIGVKGRIRTDGFTVLQTVALGLSATLTLIGASGGSRTHIGQLSVAHGI